MSNNETVVPYEPFDVDRELAELAKRRYQMPPVVLAALRQAGQKAVMRLLKMVTDDKVFESLSPKDQLKVIEAVMDRAYGRSETATAADIGAARLGNDEGENSDHFKQIEEIQKRAKLADSQGRRRGLMSPQQALDQLDRQLEKRTSARGPYPSVEDAEVVPSSEAPLPRAERRNRPVPPNVVELRGNSREV